VSWQAVRLPVDVDVYSPAIDENLIYYGISNVALGGNWRLVKCDLNVSPPTCTSLDTGIPVPNTDGHYNIRELLLEGDYLYGCWARWTGLNCYRFDKNTGAGASIGSVNPAGRSDLNYHVGIKVKEDTYYYIARVGSGAEWYLFRFKGSPSQITDSKQWEGVGYIFRDPMNPSTCPEGSINYSYCSSMFWVSERYLIFVCYNRCPSGNVGNFAVYILDALNEKLYNSNFEPIPFGLPTTDPSVKITVTNPLNTTGRISIPPQIVVDMADMKCYVGQEWIKGDGTRAGSGITKVDMRTRQATFVYIPGNYELQGVFPLFLTVDGKVAFTIRDTDNVPKLKLFDPATDTTTDILTGLGTSIPGLPPRLNTEDAQIPVFTIHQTHLDLILPPNWMDGLKTPKRITVTPGVGSLRVQAQFHIAPGSIRVRVWKIPDYTVAVEEILAGATAIDKTYSVAAGRYRVEVTAIP
jgi:hypothetical protein